MTKHNTEKSKKSAETKKPTEAETAPEASKKKASRATSDTSDQGYATSFANWECVPTEAGQCTVKTATLLSIFDTRAEPPTDKMLATLFETTKNGITSPVRFTRMRFLGPDGEYPVSPVPGELVKLKKGETYNILSFGRCRTRAGLHHGFTEMQATIASYENWGQMVTDAHVENVARKDQTQWDLSCTVHRLTQAGKTQNEIATLLQPSVSAGKVSHYVAVYSLPEPVQALYRDDAITVTHARHLRPHAQDPDFVIRWANLAVENGWSGEDMDKKIKEELAAAADTSKNEKAPKVRVRRADFSEIELAPCDTSLLRTVLANVDVAAKTKAGQAKAYKEGGDLDRYGKAHARAQYLKGVREGVLMAFGAEEIPDAFKKVEEEEAPEGAEESAED